MPPSNRISSFSKLLTNCLLLLRLLLLSLTLGLPGSLAIRCLNCRTLENQLVCDDPCEGDICALWSYREMSTEHIVQGCLTGPDLRSGLRMGCRRNRVDALLCLCNANDHCNQDQPTVLASEPSEQPMLPSDIRCQSRTSASFMRRQTIRPPRHSCHSDLCFFTQSNSTAIPADDPLGQPLATESTTSRNCGPQLEFNFDLLLGPVWPGHGLHSEACYRLETGRDLMIGCSCSNNDCNREMPYPIIEDGGRPPLVKCFLGPVKHTVQAKLSQRPAGTARGVPEHVPESLLSTPPPYCRGHFCFVQRETFHGYGDHWTSGCLSANESAARARLRAGYRNILGVEQWLCATELCNESMLRASEEARRRAEGGVGRTVDGPVAVGRGKTPAGGKAEGGRVLAQKQAAAKKRKELAAALLLAQAEPKRKRMPGNGAEMARTSTALRWLHLFTSVIIAFPALFELIHFRNLNLC